MPAGIRVQAIKKADRGAVHFGTEVFSSADRSLAALLGASPGASVSVNIAIEVVQTCLPHLLASAEGRERIRQMTLDHDLKQPGNAALLENQPRRRGKAATPFPTMITLTDKIALVTGAAGIGAAIAECFAEAGALVFASDRDEAAAQQTAARISQAGHRAESLALDVSDEMSCIAAVRTGDRKMRTLRCARQQRGHRARRHHFDHQARTIWTGCGKSMCSACIASRVQCCPA